MTAVFYAWYVTKERVKSALYWIEDKWWGLADWGSDAIDRIEFRAPAHRGADEAYAKELHHEADALKRTQELGLDYGAVEISDALDEMQRSTVAEFNEKLDAAVAEFLAKGPVVPVTDTGEILMNQLNMELWRQEQLDQIRSLAVEFAEACRA